MPTPAITRSTAILAVRDVRETVRYYREVLGFESGWEWGEGPNFGGVSWGEIQVFFNLQPRMSQHVEWHQHFFDVTDADAMLRLHRERGAVIADDIEDKPWGVREYTVRDLNGYLLRFGKGVDAGP